MKSDSGHALDQQVTGLTYAGRARFNNYDLTTEKDVFGIKTMALVIIL